MHNQATEHLLSQFEASWKMIRSAIDNISLVKFHTSYGEWYYSQNLYHIIETMDFYSRGSPDEMSWGQRAGYNWDDVQNVEDDILPLLSKQLMTDYLREMEVVITDILKPISTKELFSKDGFHWFESIFHKYIYLLRHNQHHIGELSLVLRILDEKPAKWT